MAQPNLRLWRRYSTIMITKSKNATNTTGTTIAAVTPEFFDAAATNEVVASRVVEVDPVVEMLVEVVGLVIALPQLHDAHDASG